MKTTDIDDTLNLLRAIGDTYTMGHAGLVLLDSPEAPDILKRYRCGVGEFEINLSGIAEAVSNKETREHMLRWFLPSLNKLLVTESFEAVKDFCTQNQKTKEFKAEPWYEFARMIRNALSHTFCFSFNPHDKTLLPVVWRNRKIELSMDGKALDLNFFGYQEGVQLIFDIEDFIRHRV